MSSIHSPGERVWYLAGPMSGVPKFNYPLFHRIAEVLRNSGYEVYSPAEFDSREKLEMILASPDGDLSKLPDVGTWGDFLSHDVKIIADKVRGIVFLPGWKQSRGARLEAFVALTCGHAFMEIDFFNSEALLSDVTRDYVKKEVFYNV